MNNWDRPSEAKNHRSSSEPRPPERRTEALLAFILLVLAVGLSWLLTDAVARRLADPASRAAAIFDSPIPTRRPPPTARPIEPITNPTEAYLLLNRYRRPPTPTRRPTPTQPATPTRRPTPTRQSNLDLAALANSPTQVASATEVFYFPLGMQDYWYKDYTWKGVAGFPDHDIPALNSNWWHGWGDGDINADMSIENKRELAPIRFCPRPNKVSRDEAAASAAQAALRHPGRVWLLYNEPDYPYICGETECGYPTPPPTPTHGPCMMCYHNDVQEAMRTPYPGFDDTWCHWESTGPTPTVPVYIPDLIDVMSQKAADDYAALYRSIKGADPTARVFCCGNFHTYPTTWWDGFLDYLATNHSDVKLDGVHLHTYPYSKSTNCTSLNLTTLWGDCMEDKLDDYWLFHQAYPLTRDKPIWITEYGYLGTFHDINLVRLYLLEPMVHWIGKDEYEIRPDNTATPDPYNHHYTAASWFTTYMDSSGWAHTYLLDQPFPPGVLKTPIGTVWVGLPDDTYPPVVTLTPVP